MRHATLCLLSSLLLLAACDASGPTPSDPVLPPPPVEEDPAPTLAAGDYFGEWSANGYDWGLRIRGLSTDASGDVSVAQNGISVYASAPGFSGASSATLASGTQRVDGDEVEVRLSIRGLGGETMIFEGEVSADGSRVEGRVDGRGHTTRDGSREVGPAFLDLQRE